jgi:hypothetical protein
VERDLEVGSGRLSSIGGEVGSRGLFWLLLVVVVVVVESTGDLLERQAFLSVS